jgi:hypothetical protein
LIDVESVFDEIPFSRIESFYVATEGRFTAFVTVVDSGNMLELSVWDPEVKIVLDDTEFPRYSLECMRPTVATRSSREVFVDDAVDLSICGIDQPRCRGVSLDEEPPPELPDLEDVDADFVAQCRRRGELEALVIGRRAITCESCSCLQAYEETVRIADLAALPDWWPCGDLLETCTDEDEDAFASYSATCAQAQREGELDSAEDE